MIKMVELTASRTLDDYAAVAYLTGAVHKLRDEAEHLLPQFTVHSVLMLNSAARGGGAAEMMPRTVQMLNDLGVRTRWAVMETDRPEFFRLTKRLHNMIHGQGAPALSPDDRKLYEEVSRDIAEELRMYLQSGEVLVVHDPQPLAVGAMLKKELGIPAVWRCHIGLDEDLPVTQAAWSFLKPYAEVYDHSIFSAPEYIPRYLTGRASVIYPSIDPLSNKNRLLTPHKLTSILCNAGLAKEHAPVETLSFPQSAQRLQAGGGFGAATLPDEIGFLYRPIIAQVSRWDRLKGFGPLLSGFVRLKQRLREVGAFLPPHQRRQLEIARLVLAGPDPHSVQDDPEACEVLEELCNTYCALDPELQKDIALLSLPMDSRENNELMVNVIQSCASIVVQNSLREGFGLTVTEAMFKGKPVLGTHACGIREQVRDGVDGRLVKNPEDAQEIADLLNEMLADEAGRERWSRNAQKRAFTEFLGFTQMGRAFRVLANSSLLHSRNHVQAQQVSAHMEELARSNV